MRNNHKSMCLVPHPIMLSIVLTSAVPIVATAQESTLTLEEVVVTARKREESMQTVPVSVSAFSGEQLNEIGATSVRDLTEHVPGLEFSRATNAAQIFIRGVGQKDPNPGLDPGVGVYVNGSYLARPDGQLLDTLDVQSVQVLRGPQGTLFGKNTVGGAVLMTLKEPTDELEGYIEAGAGNLDMRRVKGAISGPLSDSFSGRVTLSSRERDGYLDNVLNGTETGAEDQQAAVGQLSYSGEGSLSINALGGYSRTRNKPHGHDCILINEDALLGSSVYPSDISGTALEKACAESQDLLERDKVANNDDGGDYELDNYLASLTVNWDISDDHQFKSITSWTRQELSGQTTFGDNDGGGLMVSQQLGVLDQSELEQWAQEFQLTGFAMNGRLSYTAGLYYMFEDIDTGLGGRIADHQGFDVSQDLFVLDNVQGDPTAAAALADGNIYFFGTQNLRDNSEMENTTAAAYGQLSFDVTEWLQLTGGVRWTSEKRERDLTTQGNDNVTLFTQLITTAIVNDVQDPLPNGSSRLSMIAPLDNLPLFDARFWPEIPAALPDGVPLSDATTISGDEDWTEVSPMVSVTATLPELMLDDSAFDHVMTYFTYSEGFKAGGFEAFQEELRPFDPETVTNYELGLKVDAFDRRLRMNLAVFHMEYDDIQVRQAQVVGSRTAVIITNAGEATIDGAEFELSWLPTANLRIDASAAYIDAGYDEFDDVRNFGGLFINDLVPIDRSDEAFTEVPEKTFTLSASYTIPAGSIGTFMAYASYYYSDEVYFGLDDESWNIEDVDVTTAEDYDLVNANLMWVSPDENWTITLWGKNLGDTEYFPGGVATAESIGTFNRTKAPPRTYGMDIKFDF
ncbi:MAG: TonB-dependent receptor [Pseudomonadales bacterium]